MNLNNLYSAFKNWFNRPINLPQPGYTPTEWVDNYNSQQMIEPEPQVAPIPTFPHQNYAPRFGGPGTYPISITPTGNLTISPNATSTGSFTWTGTATNPALYIPNTTYTNTITLSGVSFYGFAQAMGVNIDTFKKVLKQYEHQVLVCEDLVDNETIIVPKKFACDYIFFACNGFVFSPPESLSIDDEVMKLYFRQPANLTEALEGVFLTPEQIDEFFIEPEA